MIPLPPHHEVARLRSYILRWYSKQKRDFPWRSTDDIYKKLIAEMMLQRTRANQVVPVYNKLVTTYSTISELSEGNKQNIYNILQPLGLVWRSKNIRSLAKLIETKCSGKIPEQKEQLLELPGIGDYVSGALITTAYNRRCWVVDSNIARFYSRFFNIPVSSEGRRDRNIISVAKIYSKSRKPRVSFYALIDFSSIICKPKTPRCGSCPVLKSCKYPNKYEIT